LALGGGGKKKKEGGYLKERRGKKSLTPLGSNSPRAMLLYLGKDGGYRGREKKGN